MQDPQAIALAATQSIRCSPGYQRLSGGERDALERDLARIEGALQAEPAGDGVGSLAASGRLADRYGGTESGYTHDPYAVPLETPDALRRGGFGLQPGPDGRGPGTPGQAPSGARGTGQPSPTEALGERARQALEAVDFPSFVAGLINGTFQAIVDATVQQVREYARLVADLSKTVSQFSRDHVTEAQVRDHLAEKYPQDLRIAIPPAGESGPARLLPRRTMDDPPEWLSGYGLSGEEFSEELTEGPLLAAARRELARDRMQQLATLVLMGINRIVVNDGTIRARLHFHARARESVRAEIGSQADARRMGIAGRQQSAQAGVSTMVSTVDVNAQSDVSIKADLVGEVSVSFRTETFDINRFADPEVLRVLNRHAAAPAAPAGPSVRSLAPNVGQSGPDTGETP